MQRYRKSGTYGVWGITDMFSKKLLLNTFGAKIKPYGFEFAGYVDRRYTFSRTADGTEQTFVIQRDPGKVFQLLMDTHVGRVWEIDEIFWDLDYHSYENGEELENILNILGDHVVNRVIPRLAELSIPKVEYVDMITDEMYAQLMQEREELQQRFLQRNGIAADQGTDVVMGSLLREMEQIKGLPFRETIETQLELAAVYGYIILCTVGGEWVLKRRSVEIAHCAFSDEKNDPLRAVSECCQKGGGAALAEQYMALIKKHRENVARERRKYGDHWEPPMTSREINEGLLSERIIKNVLIKRLEDLGFYFSSNAGHMWWMRRSPDQEELGIRIEEEAWRRKTFFIVLYTAVDGHVEEYMYKRFFFYEDEKELCSQLEQAADEIREAIREDRRIADPNGEGYGCYPTKEMEADFRVRRREMVENFWKRNGLDQASEEADILRCIAKEMDSIADADYREDMQRLLAFYKVNQKQLMELAAAYGELIVREIGGSWSVDEEWRMTHRGSFLQDVPVMNRVPLPGNLIQCWEYGGSERLLWQYQEYKWVYGEWRRLCQLAGIEV